MPVAKNPQVHGKRHSSKKKAAAVRDAKTIGWKDSAAKHGVSEQTISRKKKKSSPKKKSK